MEKINNGGPAFPAGNIRKSRSVSDPGADFRVTDITTPAQSGMTLRDYFAAKAMQGMYASDTDSWNSSGHEDARAKSAYEMADAMLFAREVQS